LALTPPKQEAEAKCEFRSWDERERERERENVGMSWGCGTAYDSRG